MAAIHLPNLLNKAASEHYNKLPIPDGKILLTYVWIDSNDPSKICAKTRTWDKVPSSASDVPTWFHGMFDENQDIVEGYLVPLRIFKDPFGLGDNRLVLCDVYVHDSKTNTRVPVVTNHRPPCLEAHKRSVHAEPWFGLEQEYTILDVDRWPIGWPKNGYPGPEGLTYYNGVGIDRNIGRQVSEAHYRACLYAGLTICGTTAETMPGQWEYQIGPISGIDVCDHIVMSRYILKRVSEDFGVVITFDPKPIKDYSGSSCHANFSTKAMREEGGMKEIEKGIEKLRKTHEKHMKVYDLNGGEDNKRRLGSHCAPPSNFVSGTFKTCCSVRIPRNCLDAGKGYLEDRRAASNCNPYAVVNALLRTVVLDE